MDYRIKTLTALLGLVIAIPSLAAGQADANFPIAPTSAETLRVQEKAESLYQRGNYERAYFIYRNELAPIGDKYAQYMLGFMHLTGKGTTEDRVAATAWYRLAAERGTKEFVTARRQLMVSLTPEQMEECDRLFVELRKKYGDLAILMRAAREDMEILDERTGSRLGSRASPVTVIDMTRSGATGSGDQYYKIVEDRLKERLEFIAGKANVEITDLDKVDIAALEAKVAESLETPD